jgi:adenine-specific DNA-methyltransferase
MSLVSVLDKLSLDDVKTLGQYFTTNKTLREIVVSFILNDPDKILEPSLGQGDLVQEVLENYNGDPKFDMYEIDPTIKLLIGVPETVEYIDFLKADIKDTYKTIIGNPPFVRTKKGNKYIDFIEKCYKLLKNDGELIFIVPSSLFKLTSAASLLNKMMEHGVFTHIYHPNKENMFKNASIDVLIFRYMKNSTMDKVVIFNGIKKSIINVKGFITFVDTLSCGQSLGDIFNIGVGMVTGREKIYRNDMGKMDMLVKYNEVKKYIWIDSMPCDDVELNKYMLYNKKSLMDRKIRKYTESNWFEWGAPRNKPMMDKYMGKDCIYINTLTRAKKVAWAGKVQYFGGALMILIPIGKINLLPVVDYFNSLEFQKQFIQSGRFKIGHRHLKLFQIDTAHLLHAK